MLSGQDGHANVLADFAIYVYFTFRYCYMMVCYRTDIDAADGQNVVN